MKYTILTLAAIWILLLGCATPQNSEQRATPIPDTFSNILDDSTVIEAALNETNIDLSTASAIRAEWIDTDRNRGDRIILFTDGKDDKYIC